MFSSEQLPASFVNHVPPEWVTFCSLYVSTLQYSDVFKPYLTQHVNTSLSQQKSKGPVLRQTWDSTLQADYLTS